MTQITANLYAPTVPRSKLVTMRIDRQLFGIPVDLVQDVIRQQSIAPVPLAPSEVAGVMNLRGRVVTVIDLRCRLRLPPLPRTQKSMFVVVELKGELYSLIVDEVGEVLELAQHEIERNPGNLEPCWRDVCDKICRLKEELLVIVDVKALLNPQ